MFLVGWLARNPSVPPVSTASLSPAVLELQVCAQPRLSFYMVPSYVIVLVKQTLLLTELSPQFPERLKNI